MAETKLSLVIDAVDRTKQAFTSASNGLDGLKKNAENLEPTFKKMAAVGTVAFGAITAVVGTAIKASAEAEAQLARVDAIIENIKPDGLNDFGGSMELAKQKARDFGLELMKVGGISDELGAESFARLLQQTGNVGKAMDGTRLAADLATAKQLDLGTATTIVSKVMAGNVGILGRYGIVVDQNATKEEAMAKMTETFGGQYEKYGKTMEGRTKVLSESFGNLKESIGDAFKVDNFKGLDFLIPQLEKMTKWASENPATIRTITFLGLAITGLIAAIGTIGLVIPKVIEGFKLIVLGIQGVGTAFTFLATNPIALFILAIIALIAAIYLIVKNWDWLKAQTISIWNSITGFIMGAIDSIKNWFVTKFDELGNWLSGWWNGLSESTRGWILLFGNILTGGLLFIITWIMANWETIKTVTIQTWNTISGAIQKTWNDLMAFIMPVLKFFSDAISKAWTAIKDALLPVWNGIKNAFSDMWEGMKTAVKDASDWIMKKLQPLLNALDKVANFGGGVVKSAGSAISSVGKSLYNALSVKDAVIDPSGRVITTDPQDYLIATKNPSGLLAGAGAGVNINLTLSGNTFMGREGIASQIGDEIANIIKKQIRI